MPICKKTNSEFKREHFLANDDMCLYHSYLSKDNHFIGSNLVFILKNDHACKNSINHIERLIIMKFPELIDQLISLDE
jgi:hypothetical protein